MLLFKAQNSVFPTQNVLVTDYIFRIIYMREWIYFFACFIMVKVPKIV